MPNFVKKQNAAVSALVANKKSAQWWLVLSRWE